MEGWTCSWSMAGVWLVKTGPSLRDQLSFPEGEERKARLIAAAPDLLNVAIEALTFIEDEAENRSAAGSAYSDYEREPRELAERLRAVVAKQTQAA